MKLVVTILSLVLIQATASASAIDCQQKAIEVAQMNIDAKARAYEHESGYIDAKSIQKSAQDQEDTVSYSMVGSIYKADYSISLTMDGSCGLKSLEIKE